MPEENIEIPGGGSVAVLLKRGPAEADLYVTEEGVLEPLNLFVLRDNRIDLLPRTHERTEVVPGRHGVYNFGSKLRPRVIELSVALSSEINPTEREKVKRNIAKYLNPTAGAKRLVFSDDEDRAYLVKYAGSIDLTQYTNWFQFTIPFKSVVHYAIGTEEKSVTGGGIAYCDGNIASPVVIKIEGPATNPEVTIRGRRVSYVGTVNAGDELIIDTEKMEAYINGDNVIHNIEADLPNTRVSHGSNYISAEGNTTVYWRDRWV